MTICPFETKDGRRIAVEFVSNVYMVDGTRVIQCNIRDITRRNQSNWNAMIITLGGRGGSYARRNVHDQPARKNRRDVTLKCSQRPHTVSVNEFNERLGSARTQAAQAMLKHRHNEHSKALTGRYPSYYGMMVLRV